MTLSYSFPRLIIFLLVASIISSAASARTLNSNIDVYSVDSEIMNPQNNTAFFISDFSEDVLLSTMDDNYGYHVEPTLAIRGNGKIFAGWKNAYSHNGGGVRVSFSKSIDNGKTWTEPFDIPMFGGILTGQSDPWLVWYNEILYYAYLEYSITSNQLSQITVAKSIDDGETWTPVSATYGDGFADKETMTISNDGIIYVVYDDVNFGTGFTTVRLTRSIDGGETFQETSIIANNDTHPGDPLAPYVTTDSNENVYVAWFWIRNESWGDTYLAVSQDQGETFSYGVDINPLSENATFTLDNDGRVSRATLPVIRFDHFDRLYILWAEKSEPNGGWDIYLRYSENYGQDWSPRARVNPNTTGDQWQPDMDIDSQGRLHLVWYDEQGATFRPYYRTIVFLGETREEMILSEPIAITAMNTSDYFTRPGDYFTIRVDSNDIPHVVWTDGRNSEMDIYYSQGIPVQTSPASPFTSAPLIWIPVVLGVLGLYCYRKKRIKIRK